MANIERLIQNADARNQHSIGKWRGHSNRYDEGNRAPEEDSRWALASKSKNNQTLKGRRESKQENWRSIKKIEIHLRN